MNKHKKGFAIEELIAIIAVIAIMMGLVLPAFAGSVGERSFVTLGASTGSGSWTNTHSYSAVRLLRLSVENNLEADNVVTVSRVISDGTTSYTQTVGAVTCASGAGTLTPPTMDGTLAGRAFVTLGAATGSGAWTNTGAAEATDLTRLSVVADLNATNVVTASRIISDGSTSYTQTVGAVTCAAGVGTQATLAYADLNEDDVLSFSSLVATGGTAIVEFDARKALPTLDYADLKYSDVLSFSSSVSTGGTVIVEYEVQKH